jgi:chorismate-pyruvate lyase
LRAGSRPLRHFLCLVVAGLAGCATPPGVMELQRTLATQDSATAALGEWCGKQHLADPPQISAQRIADDDLAPSPEVRGLLQVGPGEPLGYRHVRLSCGGKVLSVAHNWYVPSRLTLEMNRTLDKTDTPFGRAVAALHFTRRRLAAKRGPLPGCPRDTILAHRAVLDLPDGRPLSALVECYTRANLPAR